MSTKANSIGGWIGKPFNKLSEEERALLHVVVMLLRAYDYEPTKMIESIKAFYGVKLTRKALLTLLHEKAPLCRSLSAFLGGVYMAKAYELRGKGLSWSQARNRARLSLPFEVPKVVPPNITPINLSEETLPCIAYIAGVSVGDYQRTKGGLHVKDREFAEFYISMYERVTGRRPKIRRAWDGYYETSERARWVCELARSGLWIAFAMLRPTWFLKGLYDSEGGVTPHLIHKRKILCCIYIVLKTGSWIVFHVARSLLEELGYKVGCDYEAPVRRIIRGKNFAFSATLEIWIQGWAQARKFAEQIGFRINHRRQVLQDLLRLEHLNTKERYKWWMQHYEKRSGRWHRVTPEVIDT